MIVALLLAMVGTYWLHGRSPWARRLFVGHERASRSAFLWATGSLHVCWAVVFALGVGATRAFVTDHAKMPTVVVACLLAIGFCLTQVRPKAVASRRRASSRWGPSGAGW